MPQTDQFGDVLAAADVAVSRAGGTVWELAAAGLPSILVPYPYATADHQTLNARHFERGGGAVVVANDEIGSVPGLVESLLADPDRLADDARGHVVHGPRGRGRKDRRGGDRPCPPLDRHFVLNQHNLVARTSRPSGHGRSRDEELVLNQHKVLAGRRLYFVGIGGSGMSAYANIARALGAEVRGWDLRETIFMGSLAGIEVDVGGDPRRRRAGRSSSRPPTCSAARGSAGPSSWRSSSPHSPRSWSAARTARRRRRR